MSLTRLTAVVVLTGAVCLTSACGGSSADPGQGALGSTVDPTPTTPPVDTPTPSPTTTTLTPTPTAKPSPTAAGGGDGGADGTVGGSTAGGGVCTRISASQVGAIVGARVTGSAVPDVTGCKFDQGGNHGTSVTVIDKSAAQAGGISGAKDEANSAVEGTPEDVKGIGSAAFVLTGGMFGGPDVNGAGAVQVGNRIVSVYLVQRSGMTAAKVRNLEISLLKLVAKARA